MTQAALLDRKAVKQTPRELERWLRGTATNLDELLRSVPGLTMENDYRGTLAVGPLHAELRVEPHQWIRTSLVVDEPSDPWDALRVNHWLPGNLRYAVASGRVSLVAETMINGVAHLPQSLAEVRRGIESAIVRASEKLGGVETPPPAQSDVDRKALASVLARLPFGEQAVVQRGESADDDSAWEVRPRFGGESTAVLLDSLGPQIRLHRTVLADAPRSAPVADQALRLNDRFRLCRLALVGKDLAAETVLHAGLLEPCWIAAAAQAVAVASRCSQETLEALARHDEAARWYAALLLERGRVTPWPAGQET